MERLRQGKTGRREGRAGGERREGGGGGGGGRGGSPGEREGDREAGAAAKRTQEPDSQGLHSAKAAQKSSHGTSSLQRRVCQSARRSGWRIPRWGPVS